MVDTKVMQKIKIECPICHKEFGSLSYMLHVGMDCKSQNTNKEEGKVK